MSATAPPRGPGNAPPGAPPRSAWVAGGSGLSGRALLDVLLEATPKGLDLDSVREHIRGVPGVVDVHDLHAWTITSGVPVLSAHVVVDDDCMNSGRSGQVLDALDQCLGDHFDTQHCTFQIEPVAHGAHESARHT